MATVYNVFDSSDLDLAQAIFDDIWASLPADIRTSSRKAEVKEWLAKQVLTSIKSGEELASNCLKTRVIGTDFSAWC
jgi:hypothetical protein